MQAQEQATETAEVQEPEPVEPNPVEIETTETIETEPPAVVESTTDPSGKFITRIASSGSDQVQITVHADTWADIEDSVGHRLAYDLFRADQVIVLTGEAPFKVFFGNGHGVEVMLNNQVIEIAPYTRDDNTTRLVIGG